MYIDWLELSRNDLNNFLMGVLDAEEKKTFTWLLEQLKDYKGKPIICKKTLIIRKDISKRKITTQTLAKRIKNKEHNKYYYE